MAAIAIRTLNRARMVSGLMGAAAFGYAINTMNPVARSRPTIKAPELAYVVAPTVETMETPAESVMVSPLPPITIEPTVPTGWDAVSVDTPGGSPTDDEIRAVLVAEAKVLGIKGVNARWKLETIREKIVAVKMA